MEELPINKQTQAVEHNGEQHSTGNFVNQMQRCSTAGIPVCTDSTHHCGDTSTDVLTQNDGNCRTEGDHTGDTQTLQNTDGSGGGLDHSGQHSTKHNTQNGILKGNHQLCEPGFVFQELHGIAHDLHTGHQSHKAQQDGADALLLLALGEHEQHDTDHTQNGGQGSGLEELQNTGAGQIAQRQQPAGDGGTDVRTQDHAHSLLQVHDTGVDEAHHHNGGSGRGLDHSGDRQTQNAALPNGRTHFCQDVLQLAAGSTLQGLAHHVHTEEEQSQTTQQGDDFQNVV